MSDEISQPILTEQEQADIILKTTIKEYEQYKNLKFFCELAWSNCNNQDDFIFMINGKRGTGKSTFGTNFLKFYLTRFLKVPFNNKVMRQCMVCDADLLYDRIHNLPAKWPIILDEAVVAAYVGDFASRNVKELTKLFTICRTKNRAVGIVTPEFFDVVTRLRNYCVYRIRCLCRGVSVLYSRDDGEGTAGDPYHLKELKDLEGVYDRTTLPQDVINKIKRHPCFKDVIKFPKLGVQEQEWYDKYRTEMTFDRVQEKFLGSECIANIYFNLCDKLEELKTLKKFTKRYFVESICHNPISGRNFLRLQDFVKHYKDFSLKLEQKEIAKSEVVSDEKQVVN